MLPILLTILKIIGIVFLLILGLMIFLLLLVLLVPVRYSLSGVYKDSIRGKAKITWLLHAISLGITYENELDIAVRILGKRLFQKKHVSERREYPEDSLESLEEELGREVGDEPDLEILSLDSKDSGEDSFSQEEFIADEESAGEDGKKNRKKGKTRLTDRINQVRRSFQEKWKVIADYKEKITAFVADKENQKTFLLIWRQLKSVVRHILPTKVKGKLVFGFDDPSTTGNILAGLSILYAWYGDSFQVTPVFDEKILEAEGSLTGRIRFGTLLVLFVRILLNKNFRVLVRRWLKNGGILDGGE